MSFATEVKAELASVENDLNCALAQSYALLLSGRAFSGTELSLLTENETVAKAYTEAIGRLADAEVTPEITGAGNYKITVEDNNYRIAAVIGIMVFIVTAVISLVVYNTMPSVKDEEAFQ